MLFSNLDAIEDNTNDVNASESDSGWSTSDGESSVATTDCESLPGEQDLSTSTQRRRLLCGYEWRKRCSFCFDTEFMVVAFRVEREDGTVTCNVMGDSDEMKRFAKAKHGIELGMVSVMEGHSFLGRACPSCCKGQGDVELAEVLNAWDMHEAAKHRILRVALPNKLT